MGPRSVDRGRLVEYPSTAPGYSLLQWGHDQLIVEGDVCLIASFGFLDASMGPRSVDRGRRGPRGHVALEAKLQWGHDQLIVEGTKARKAAMAAAKCFNGATIS